jgi:uncharacterized protein YjiS (DUF1127 family)
MNVATRQMDSSRAFYAKPLPWHARAANGFGDVAPTAAASAARPTSYEMYHATHNHPSFTLGEIIVAMIQAAGAIARRAYERHRQRREAAATYAALCQLDDRMLRDLGFDRSQIRCIAEKVTGEAAYNRVRTTSHYLPY